MGQLHLTDKQRKFLNKSLELYNKGHLSDLPFGRVNNILRNGYYFNDKSSYYTPPRYSPMNDVKKLNSFRNSARIYIDNNKK